MTRKTTKRRLVNYLIIIVAASAVCWDIAVATLDVEPGTFRYESEFDAISGETVQVGIVTSDYAELSDPVDRTVNPSYMQIEEMVGKASELQGGFEGVVNKGDKVTVAIGDFRATDIEVE